MIRVHFEYKLQLDYAEVPALINYLDHNRLIALPDYLMEDYSGQGRSSTQ